VLYTWRKKGRKNEMKRKNTEKKQEEGKEGKVKNSRPLGARKGIFDSEPRVPPSQAVQIYKRVAPFIPFCCYVENT
jgi:hypothetical protein